MAKSRRRKVAVRVATVAMVGGVATVGLSPSEQVGATNFGSSAQDTGPAAPRLGDIYIQEYSVYPGGQSEASFGALAYAAIESLYEPTDLSVARAADNTLQDVHIQALNTGGFRTICRTDIAAIYGAHHHRVCDVKKIEINVASSSWQGWNDAQRKYIFAHEFGHSVGLRHSNNSEPGTAENGTLIANTHPNEWGSVMHTLGMGSFALHNPHDIQHINVHYG